MGFKEVADLDCETTTAIGGKNKETGKPNPKSIEGYFIGTKQVESKKSKTGTANLHVLQTPKGNVGVWGKTNLDQKMLTVAPGSAVRISFIGMVETRNNPMYKYKVEVDTENSIEVTGSNFTTKDGEEEGTQSFGAAETEEETYEDEEAETDVEEDETPADELPPARPTVRRTATAPSAARQARVQALLNNGRGKVSA